MDDKIKFSGELPDQEGGDVRADKSSGTVTTSDLKTSERRRNLLKVGIVTVPIVITLHSGPAAASACVSCDPSNYENMFGAATTDLESQPEDNPDLYYETPVQKNKKEKTNNGRRNGPRG